MPERMRTFPAVERWRRATEHRRPRAMACLFADFLDEFLLDGPARRATFDALARLVWDMYAEDDLDSAWEFRLRLKERLTRDGAAPVVWEAAALALRGRRLRRGGEGGTGGRRMGA